MRKSAVPSGLHSILLTALVFSTCAALAGTDGAGGTSGTQAAAPDTTGKASDIKDADGKQAAPADGDFKTQNWLFHAQATEIVNGQPGFKSPYEGANSLPSDASARQTTSVDIFLAARLWEGGAIYFNPEYEEGFGLGDSRGIAAYPNSDAIDFGKQSGNVIVPHLYFQQVFGLGGEQENIDSGQLQLAETVDVSRITLTLGRLEVGDQFDNNTYSHDGRAQFMNWALVDAGAFDYSQDAFGAIEGATLELNQKNWAVRYGIFDVPKVSGGSAKDQNFDKAWQQMVELETRYTLGGHPGKTRLLGWIEEADMGSYGNTVADPALMADITATRRYRLEYGWVMNLEQEVASNLGAFLRASWRDGHAEEWQFTDIDRSLSLGLQASGKAWKRDNDVFGLAGVVDGLSNSHKEFLAIGGLGPQVGDGQLPHYGLESVVETYYDAQIVDHVHLALDYQFVVNPAYNEDRGPVSIISARLHLEF